MEKTYTVVNSKMLQGLFSNMFDSIKIILARRSYARGDRDRPGPV